LRSARFSNSEGGQAKRSQKSDLRSRVGAESGTVMAVRVHGASLTTLTTPRNSFAWLKVSLKAVNIIFLKEADRTPRPVILDGMTCLSLAAEVSPSLSAASIRERGREACLGDVFILSSRRRLVSLNLDPVGPARPTSRFRA